MRDLFLSRCRFHKWLSVFQEAHVVTAWEGLRSVHAKKNIQNFCVNRGDKLLCFYTNVAFKNIGFRAIFRAFSFA